MLRATRTILMSSARGFTAKASPSVAFRVPSIADAKSMYDIVVKGTLDTNSAYSYMAFCKHFADSCIVAETAEHGVVGFVKGYRPPKQLDTIFIWQIGVRNEMQGTGLGGRMLVGLAKRLADDGVRFMEATVTPTNDASRNLFKGFARRTGSECVITPSFFREEDFPALEPKHAAEDLFRIGPYAADAIPEVK